MKTLIYRLKRLCRQALAAFPSPIPTGMAEFDAWVDSITNTFTLPTQEKDTIRFAFATMIMHLGPTAAYKPKLYFVLALKAGAAKQIASAAFQEIKQKQQAAATASQNAAANGPQKLGV